jgi:hypothetical protein
MNYKKKEISLKGPFHKKYVMRLEKLEIPSGIFYTLYKNNNPILKLDEKNLMKLKMLLGEKFNEN